LPVTWFVMAAPTMISLSQLRQLKHLLFTHVDENCQKSSVHNDEQSVARPVQPLGSLRIIGSTNLLEDVPRVVTHCQEGDFEPDVPISTLETADVNDLGNW
jgi:Eukaryotic-type carbonic anhydrase